MAYDSYFLMQTKDVADYAKKKLDVFDQDADLETVEIGDGNLNYIFLVSDPRSNNSVVIKQAGDTARISDDFKISPDRNRIEYDILKLQSELAPGLVPTVYGYDENMNCTIMEDLSDHAVMRHALVDHQEFPQFAEHITTFMANTLLLTSDVVMDHKEKKRMLGSFINPDLCEITEELVYTEPFNDIRQRNATFPPNEDFVQRELYSDKALLRETAKLKFDFMTKGQSLIHGDLHTGSVFVRPDSTKVIDPEFAFYGPAGVDVGMILANIIFAWANGHATIDDNSFRAGYTERLEETLTDVLQLFQDKWNRLWRDHATETVAHYDGVRKWYLEDVLRDSAGVTGLELCRRIVGLAQVKDITSIEDETQRLRAERTCLTAAKSYIKEPDGMHTGRHYLEPLHRAARKHELI